MTNHKELLWEMDDMSKEDLQEFIIYCWTFSIVPTLPNIKLWKYNKSKESK